MPILWALPLKGRSLGCALSQKKFVLFVVVFNHKKHKLFLREPPLYRYGLKWIVLEPFLTFVPISRFLQALLDGNKLGVAKVLMGFFRTTVPRRSQNLFSSFDVEIYFFLS
jgi:hypothetical protein